MNPRTRALPISFLILAVLSVVVGCGDGENARMLSSDAEAVAADRAWLTWDLIKGEAGFENPSERDVHFDLSVVSVGSQGSIITWQSTDEARVSTDGSVTMSPVGSGPAAVTFTATITMGVESDTKQFSLTVREAPVLTDEQAMADAVLALVNVERANAGLAPLTQNVLLVNAARRHSQDMANHGFMNHTGSDQSRFSERITDAGYSWTSCQENIAWNYPSAAIVMAAWMGSAGHRANILNPNSQHMGISCFRSVHGYYWTQAFGRP